MDAGEAFLIGVVRMLGVMLLIGWIPALIAWKKGRNFLLWWLYGGALFIIALIHALALGRRGPARAANECPECGQLPSEHAGWCPQRRADIGEQPAENGPFGAQVEGVGPAHSQADAVLLMQQALRSPPPLLYTTPRTTRVKRIDPATGHVLFEVDFSGGIRFGIVPSGEGQEGVLIYAGGNLFLVPRDSAAIAERTN